MLIACVNQDRGVKPGAHKGAAVHVAAMREAFAALGCDVVAIDAKEDVAVREALESAGHPDLVYERYALDCGAASRFCRARGVPHVLEVNAPLMEEAARHRQYVITPEAIARETDVFLGARLVVAVSRAVADAVTTRGVPAGHVIVRSNGVDTRRFVPRPRPSGPDGPFVLGFHGRLRPWHGFGRLVDVFSKLLERGLKVRLEIVGAGDFEEVLRDRVPAEHWTHTAWVSHDRVAARVARFDALALTYDPETPCYFSPLKLLEAMAVGAVPVVPRMGDLDRIVRDGVSGVVYPPGDQPRLVAELARLVEDKNWRIRLMQGAVEEAQRHSWTALAREVVAAVTERDPVIP